MIKKIQFKVCTLFGFPLPEHLWALVTSRLFFFQAVYFFKSSTSVVFQASKTFKVYLLPLAAFSVILKKQPMAT